MIGVGYVGLVTGTCFAEVGYDVCCLDTDLEKLGRLRQGITPIFEPGLEIMIQRNIDADRLTFTHDYSLALKDARIAFIAVGTPEGEDGSADLKYVKAVANSIAQNITSDMIVVVKSTVPIGTGDMVESIICEELAKRNLEFKVDVISNPEFLKEGNAVQDFLRPDRVVIGFEDNSNLEFLKELYKPFILDDEGKLLFMDRRSSELTKYAANAMLATRISFMNEMAQLCEKVGANVDHIRHGIGADPRIGRKFLYAGPGYGGSCFPKDVKAILKTADLFHSDLSVLKAVDQANDKQRAYVIEKVRKVFPQLRGLRFAIWGLSFKPGTDDIRETPSLSLIRALLAGGAEVVAHDPEGSANFAKEIGDHVGLSYVDDYLEAVKGASAVVLMTEWIEYRAPNWDKISGLMAKKVIFDFRNQYSKAELEGKQFAYQCIGRPESLKDSELGLDKQQNFSGHPLPKSQSRPLSELAK